MTLHRSSSEGRNFGTGKCCCNVLIGLLVTRMSWSLRIRVRGSVIPLMYGRVAKFRYGGSTQLAKPKDPSAPGKNYASWYRIRNIFSFYNQLV